MLSSYTRSKGHFRSLLPTSGAVPCSSSESSVFPDSVITETELRNFIFLLVRASEQGK